MRDYLPKEGGGIEFTCEHLSGDLSPQRFLPLLLHHILQDWINPLSKLSVLLRLSVALHESHHLFPTLRRHCGFVNSLLFTNGGVGECNGSLLRALVELFLVVDDGVKEEVSGILVFLAVEPCNKGNTVENCDQQHS